MGAFTVMVGPRACVIIGSLTVTAGLLAAVPAVSIVHIAFTLGALVGMVWCCRIFWHYFGVKMLGGREFALSKRLDNLLPK